MNQLADGLITNEYAFSGHTFDGAAVMSDEWQVTSGSLFAKGCVGWTGVPDDAHGGTTRVDATSSNVTNSGVFRARTVRSDYADITVTFDVWVNEFVVAGPSLPAQNWDGLHVFLRYLSPFNLYYVSVIRRDGAVVIKRKVSGIPAAEASPTAESAGNPNGYYEGPTGNVSNHGAYYTLAQTPTGRHPARLNAWLAVSVSACTNPTGTVTLTAALDGHEVLRATDDATKYAGEWTGKRDGWGGTTKPITGAGRTGLRGDNLDFAFRSFVVDR